MDKVHSVRRGGTESKKRQVCKVFDWLLTSTSIIELIEPLSRHLTVGKFKILSLTCKSLYFSILSFYVQKIQQRIVRPFRMQIVFEIQCPHRCSGDDTSPFVIKKGRIRKGSNTQQYNYYCTRCLYSFQTSTLFQSTWWICPTHEKFVEDMREKVGNNHSLLTALSRNGV
jgi:hypothetical protein